MPIFLARFLALRGSHGGGVLAANPDLAGSGSLETDESTQERALAGAGAAENNHRLALEDIEADAMQNLAFAIADAKVADGDHGFAGR